MVDLKLNAKMIYEPKKIHTCCFLLMYMKALSCTLHKKRKQPPTEMHMICGLHAPYVRPTLLLHRYCCIKWTHSSRGWCLIQPSNRASNLDHPCNNNAVFNLFFCKKKTQQCFKLIREELTENLHTLYFAIKINVGIS